MRIADKRRHTIEGAVEYAARAASIGSSDFTSKVGATPDVVDVSFVTHSCIIELTEAPKGRVEHARYIGSTSEIDKVEEIIRNGGGGGKAGIAVESGVEHTA